MKIQELFEQTSSNQQMSKDEVLAIIDEWRSWQTFPHDYYDKFVVAKDGTVSCNMPKFQITERMLTPEGTLPFKITRAKCIHVYTSALSSFKNFPEYIETPKSSKIDALKLEGVNFPKLTSLESIPKYSKGVLNLWEAQNLSFANVHNHILEADKIYISGNKPSPILGFLKIKNLKTVWISSESIDDFERAIDILNEFLPNGNTIACQRKLIENDLDEYAEF
jgi:hypothetical protein